MIPLLNATSAATLLTTPLSLLASVPRPSFAFVSAAHIKLKADNIAMVFFCIARHVWVFVEGRRDSGEGKRGVEKAEKKERGGGRRKGGDTGRRERELRTNKRKRVRMVARGRYKLVLA